jgi:hypothetical protein
MSEIKDFCIIRDVKTVKFSRFCLSHFHCSECICRNYGVEQSLDGGLCLIMYGEEEIESR